MYQPSKQVLDKYADLLINFALNRGNGIKKGDVVLLQVPECAKPLLVALRRAVLKAGGHSIIQYIPDGMQREFYSLANENQLSFFPEKYFLTAENTEPDEPPTNKLYSFNNSWHIFVVDASSTVISFFTPGILAIDSCLGLTIDR